MSTWAIVPVKPLKRGKSRLSNLLSAEQRAELATELFTHVVETLQTVNEIDVILTVSRDKAIIALAEELGTRVFSGENPVNLNSALTGSAALAWQEGAATIIVLPADLALLESTDVATILSQDATVAICPDDKFDGTNALMLRHLPEFTFRYGDESFSKHLAVAADLGQTAQVVYADSIEFDLDTPGDWQQYQRLQEKVTA